MRLQITATTDGKYLGQTFEFDDHIIVLDDDVIFEAERTMQLPDGVRFISSNYILDAREV